MSDHVSRRLAVLFAGAVLLTTTHCYRPRSFNPAQGDYPNSRWAMVVFYEQDGTCKHVAGPPRAGVFLGEPLVWRVYNGCRTAHTVAITNVQFVGDADYARRNPPLEHTPAFRGASNPAAPAAAAGQARPAGDAGGDLFLELAGLRTTNVGPGQWRDLTLTTRKDARVGVYSYVTVLDGTPDQDQEVDTWKP